MDYHFYQAQKSSARSPLHLRRVFMYFLPVFVVAAILPILVTLVKNPVDTTFRADASQNELAVWIEPANVEVSVGKTVTFSVMALFDSEGKVLPGVTIPLVTPTTATTSLSVIEYKRPFNGQVKLGEFQFTPDSTGTMQISIDKSSVVSDTYTEILPVSVSSAVIVVH